MKKLLAILMLGFFVVGCSAHTGTVTSRDLTTLGGCAVGGIAGSKIGSGSGILLNSFIISNIDKCSMNLSLSVNPMKVIC